MSLGSVKVTAFLNFVYMVQFSAAVVDGATDYVDWFFEVLLSYAVISTSETGWISALSLVYSDFSGFLKYFDYVINNK